MVKMVNKVGKVHMVNMADIIGMHRLFLLSTRPTWCKVKWKSNMINNTNIFKMVNIVNMVNMIYKFDMIVF